MGLKKRNKVTAQFNMSSLTDIIFLLLIFFMLTSSLIMPNALNLQLPGTSNSTQTVSERPDQITISSGGKYQLNGTAVSSSTLNKRLNGIYQAKGKDAGVIVAPDGHVGNQHVVTVLDMVRMNRLKAILYEPDN